MKGTVVLPSTTALPATVRPWKEEAGGTEEPRLGVLGYGPDEHERQHRFWEVCSSGK